MPTIKLNQQAMLGLLLATGLITAATLTYIGWQWRQDWQLTHQAPTLPTTPLTMTSKMPQVADIPKQHIFGKALKQGNLPITNLQMQITGIVQMGNGAGASKVYLSVAGQPSKIYKVGDDLPYGVKIFKITPDTVILNNDGHLEKLSLEREKLEFKKSMGITNDV